MIKKSKKVAIAMALAFGLNIVTPVATNIFAASVNIDVRNIANGMKFTEKQVLNGPNKDILQRVNIIEADLKAEGAEIIFAKGKSTAVGKDKLSVQMKDIEKSGKKVVGGVNADFFQMSTGSSLGPHVEEGVILTSYSSKSDEQKFPIINIDNNNNVSIDTLSMKGSLGILPYEMSDIPDEAIESSDMMHTEIYAVNRYEFYRDAQFEPKDKVIIMTPNYSSDRVLKPMSYAPDDLFVVVKSSDSNDAPLKNGGLVLGQKHTGIVTEIAKGKAVTIPQNGYVIACSGNQAKLVEDSLKVGSKVRVDFDFNKPNIKQAIAGHSYLVENGKAYSESQLKDIYKNSINVNSRRSRTAFGIDKNGKAVAIILQGGSATSQISSGATIPELSKTMEDMGIVTAVNLDGGGSTQMNVKQYAWDENKIVNVPEDGDERSVSNSILFVTAKQSSSGVGSLRLEDTFYIYQGSTHKVGIKGEDQYFNEIDLSDKEIKWSVKGGDSTIDSKGVFKAGNTDEMVEIVAESNGVKASTYAIVVNEIGSLKSNTSDVLHLRKGNSIGLDVSAKTLNNQNVFIDKSAVKWSVSNNIGTVGLDGTLNITAEDGEGILKGQAGGRSLEVMIKIGKNSDIIDDFEKGNIKYTIGGYVGGKGELSYEQSYNGAQSYKVTYDYSKWDKKYNGSIELKPLNNPNEFVAYSKPDKIGVMIYGDGKAPWVRAKIVDGNGDEYTVDLSKEGVTWENEWRQVTTTIPKEAVAPIRLTQIYMVETDKSKSNQTGTVYFDDIRFIYGNDDSNKRVASTTKITDMKPN